MVFIFLIGLFSLIILISGFIYWLIQKIPTVYINKIKVILARFLPCIKFNKVHNSDEIHSCEEDLESARKRLNENSLENAIDMITSPISYDVAKDSHPRNFRRHSSRARYDNKARLQHKLDEINNPALKLDASFNNRSLLEPPKSDQSVVLTAQHMHKKSKTQPDFLAAFKGMYQNSTTNQT